MTHRSTVQQMVNPGKRIYFVSQQTTQATMMSSSMSTGETTPMRSGLAHMTQEKKQQQFIHGQKKEHIPSK